MKQVSFKKAIQLWQGIQPVSDRDRERLSRRFTIDYNYNSNHIEGNTLTYGQTEILLLFGKIVGEATVRDVQEMTASNVGLKIMSEEAKLPDMPLTQNFIRTLHKTLLREDYTVYRNLPGGMQTSYTIHAGRYKTLFGNGVKSDTLAAMDPRNAICSGMAPLLCTHAEDDQVVPVASHIAFAEAYRAAGNTCEFFRYPCDVQPGLTGHCIWRPRSHPHKLIGPIEERIRAFFNKVKKGAK